MAAPLAGASAPVGQACTHSPQATQVDAPIASSMSNTMRACSPRQARPMTSLTCSSRQARTQRVHWMQASRLTAIAGWLLSAAMAARAANRGRPTPSRVAHISTSLSRLCAVSGRSDCSSSSTRRCEARARALAVLTSMPALGRRQHDAASTRSPSTSTTQARQLPAGSRPGVQHRCGISTPTRCATSMIVSPGRASTGRPSSVKFTVGSCSDKRRARSARVTAFIAAPRRRSAPARRPSRWARPGPNRRSTRRA